MGLKIHHCNMYFVKKNYFGDKKISVYTEIKKVNYLWCIIGSTHGDAYNDGMTYTAYCKSWFDDGFDCTEKKHLRKDKYVHDISFI